MVGFFFFVFSLFLVCMSISVCVCTRVCVFMCVQVCICVEAGNVVLPRLFILFLKDRTFPWSGTHWLGWAVLPTSPKDPPVSFPPPHWDYRPDLFTCFWGSNSGLQTLYCLSSLLSPIMAISYPSLGTGCFSFDMIPWIPWRTHQAVNRASASRSDSLPSSYSQFGLEGLHSTSMGIGHLAQLAAFHAGVRS